MILIMIPAYNEEKNIPILLKDIEQSLNDADVEHCYVVVNDGSTDNTGALLDDFAKELPLEVLHHEKNMNLGGGMRTGLNRALEICNEDDFIVTMDADNSHPPKEILRIYERLLDGPDVVIASRYKKGGEEMGVPLYRIVLSKGANWLFKLFFPIKHVSDYTGSFRGMRASALKKAWKAKGADVLEEVGFTVMPEILLQLRGADLNFREIPLVLRYDLKNDPSKMRIFDNIFGTLNLIFRLFFRRILGRKG